jgi:hypothetical protein
MTVGRCDVDVAAQERLAVLGVLRREVSRTREDLRMRLGR